MGKNKFKYDLDDMQTVRDMFDRSSEYAAGLLKLSDDEMASLMGIVSSEMPKRAVMIMSGAKVIRQLMNDDDKGFKQMVEVVRELHDFDESTALAHISLCVSISMVLGDDLMEYGKLGKVE